MRWLGLVIVAFAMFMVSPSLAQGIPAPPPAKPSAADEATAKRNFESGLKLYGEGSFAEALIAFEQSYRLGGRPSALKNIAQCHRNLKHFVEAYEAYDQMVSLHDAQLPAPDKRAVQQALEELGVLTGTIAVTVSEADAEIAIDGKVVTRSPMAKPKRVTVASHSVRVTKPGFEPYAQDIAIGSQEKKTVEVKLETEKTSGRIVVREQSGREVHVFVDGVDKGPAPWEGDVPTGEHTIEAKSARFASDVRRVAIAAKERMDVALDATPLTGRLRVTTIPAHASIAIDGRPVGSGAWEGELVEGSHRIEVALPGQAPQVREVSLARGQLVVQEIPLVAVLSGGITDYAGLYVRVALMGMLGVAGNAENEQPPLVRLNGGFMAGAGASLRIGHAWDWYGAEGVAIFMLEHRNRDYEYAAPAPQQTTTFGDESNSPNFFLGAGGRATSKHESVRFTAGLAPGIVVRTFHPYRDRHCDDGGNCQGQDPSSGSGGRFVSTGGTSFTNTSSTSSSHDFQTAGYTTVGFAMDAGILFGSTPGTKFFLGMQAWLDFPPDTLVTGPDTVIPLPNTAYAHPGRGITLIDGPQFYLGPSLGLQFGH